MGRRTLIEIGSAFPMMVMPDRRPMQATTGNNQGNKKFPAKKY
jgi:hypothetical protein